MRKCKWALLAVLVVSGFSSTASAFPRVMNYQGILRNGGGAIVPDGSYSVTFRFYDASSAGNKLWEETQVVNTRQGLFNALLGSTVQVPDSVFTNDSWLSTAVAGDPELLPRTQVASVGYAYKARNADMVGGLGPDQLVYPSMPARVFRCLAPSAGTFTFSPSGSTRQITGIFAASGAAGVSIVSIGGSMATLLAIPSGGGSVMWSSGNGAPIQVGPTESIVIEDSGGSVLVTGFEY